MRLIVALCLLVAACAQVPLETTTSTPVSVPGSSTTVGPVDWDTSKPFAGFSLSPMSYDDAGFTTFFETASAASSLVAWVGAWQELEQGGTLVYDLSSQYGYVPVAVTGFPTDASGLRVLPDDPAEMIQTIASWVADHPVPFLGVGVEINSFLWEKAPEDFEEFVAIFPDIVSAVHAASPDTKVFPGFQLERLRGLRGGLYGEEDASAEWELLDRFPTADAIGFTTYPGLVFPSVADVPDDHYVEILSHTDKPVVFTEVGWQAGGAFAEWSGSPEEQADFVALRVSEIAVLANMVIWSFLWDQQAGPEPFWTMGLIDGTGTERPSFDLWDNLFG